MEYGTFEGRIPEGEYGAGEVTIWDAGSFELEKWREGEEVIVTLNGEKHGTNKYALIHTGKDSSENNWLIHLMAPAGRTKKTRTVVGSGRGRQRAVMLATLGTEGQLDPDEDWAFEMKWDGIRALVEVSNGEVRLTSRNGTDLTATYPELRAIGTAVKSDAVLDGEIVALDKRGRPDFGLLQQRMNLTKESEVAAARAKTPVCIMLFDVLELNGEPMVKKTYSTRRAALDKAVKAGKIVQVPPAFEGDETAAMQSSRELGLEGVMAKRTDSLYLPGKRSSSWIKLKHHRSQEVVVAGWRPGSGRRADTIGSLLLAVPHDDGLHYVGRVGTGFGDRELERITSKLASMSRKTNPMLDVPAADAKDAHWVRPSLVGEVEFAEWTATGRLRQPSWRGWRTDKKPADVRVE
jgi:bifunctional non-homologous end joining protein LigD